MTSKLRSKKQRNYSTLSVIQLFSFPDFVHFPYFCTTLQRNPSICIRLSIFIFEAVTPDCIPSSLRQNVLVSAVKTAWCGHIVPSRAHLTYVTCNFHLIVILLELWVTLSGPITRRYSPAPIPCPKPISDQFAIRS